MILVKIYGGDWSPLTFGNKPITDFDTAIDMAIKTRFRCKLKLVIDDKTIRKWNNL